MKLEIREIARGTESDSAEYKLEIELRTRILRDPLGFSFTEDEIKRKDTDLHIGAFSGEKLVGCLFLTPLAGSAIKMRQIAVDFEAQGQGIGRKLVEFSEAKARQLGFTEMLLHAREVAVPFYLKLGYELEGAVFIEATIPHFKMRKRLRG